MIPLRNHCVDSEASPTRYIRRSETAESNVEPVRFVKQRGHKLMYHKLIDRPWIKLGAEFFLLYTFMFLVFATFCYYTRMAKASFDSSDPSLSKRYEQNYWELCFEFAVHTGTTIGYGHLLLREVYPAAFGFALFVFVYATEIFEVLFVGVWTQKIKVDLLHFSSFLIV